MFDADLNVKLSQHLFNIQFECYLRRRAGGADHLALDDTEKCQGHDSTLASEQSSPHLSDRSPERPPESQVPSPRPVTQTTSEPVQFQSAPNSASSLKTALEDTNKLLAEIGDRLKDVKRVMIVLHQGMVRGLNRTMYSEYDGLAFKHALVNAKGEDPHLCGLPDLNTLRDSMNNNSPTLDTDLARYLHFYGIGEELLEGGDEPKLKEGKRDDAKGKLRLYLSMPYNSGGSHGYLGSF
ncbi:hypothetical protein FRC07_010672 [Ceratobasidium sp. 392]|nr:hypothetical protein FRC07_010672 [Ceratobasidium sp. 392]